MRLFDAIVERVNWIRSYMLGRGLLSLAMITAGVIGSMTSLGFLVPALVVAIGGTVFNGYMALRTERMHEQRMMRTYRNEIAAAVGVPPTAITRDHLYAVAQENSVIAQALARERTRVRIDFITGTLAGAATFGLLYVGLAHTSIATFLSQTFGTIIGGVLSVFSIGMVAGTSGLVINNGLGYAVGEGIGLNKASAHDRILRMEWQVRRGRTVTPDQVFGVLMASDPAMERNIRQQFGKSYDAMNGRERNQVVRASGLAEDMLLLSNALNNRTLLPSSLAFVFGQKFDRLAPTPVVAENEASTVSRGSFVERYASARPPQSHTQRLSAERSLAAMPTRTV